jgi:hypothetical protein
MTAFMADNAGEAWLIPLNEHTNKYALSQEFLEHGYRHG